LFCTRFPNINTPPHPTHCPKAFPFKQHQNVLQAIPSHRLGILHTEHCSQTQMTTTVTPFHKLNLVSGKLRTPLLARQAAWPQQSPPSRGPRERHHELCSLPSRPLGASAMLCSGLWAQWSPRPARGTIRTARLHRCASRFPTSTSPHCSPSHVPRSSPPWFLCVCSKRCRRPASCRPGRRGLPTRAALFGRRSFPLFGFPSGVSENCKPHRLPEPIFAGGAFQSPRMDAAVRRSQIGAKNQLTERSPARLRVPSEPCSAVR
jgi:hypothetical protein